MMTGIHPKELRSEGPRFKNFPLRLRRGLERVSSGGQMQRTGGTKYHTIQVTKPGSGQRASPHEPEEWTEQAVCSESSNDPEWFSADAGPEVGLAMACCERCPVMEICRDGAVKRDERQGIWGGRQFGQCSKAQHELLLVLRPTKTDLGRKKCLNCERDATRKGRVVPIMKGKM